MSGAGAARVRALLVIALALGNIAVTNAFGQAKNCGTIDNAALGTWGGHSVVQGLFADEGDTLDAPTRSRLEIFENGRRIGPGHSLHVDIINQGAGRFSHWYTALIFSASDLSDPRTNGRVYTYGVTEGPCPTQVCDPIRSTNLPTESLAHLLHPFSPVGFVNHRSQAIFGDTLEQPSVSPVRLYEENRPLGPAHSIHQTIRDSGAGRFSHWYTGLYFSASDSTSPNTNGRNYYYGAPVCSRERAPSIVIVPNNGAGAYAAYERDVQLFAGTHLANHVLQPTLDLLKARANGGVIRLAAADPSAPFRMAGNSTRGRSGVKPYEFEIDVFSNVSILGSRRADGSPATAISIDSGMGNVFDAYNKDNIFIANLRIEANNLATYIFTSMASRNVTIDNVHVYRPNGAGFGHRAGTNISYVNCKAFGENPLFGHGFAVGGSYVGIVDGVQVAIQDTGTRIINGESSGFANSQGGQGIHIRGNPIDVDPTFDPELPNLGVRISGGRYYNNGSGIQVRGSKDVVIENAEVFNNPGNGVEAVTSYRNFNNSGEVSPGNQLQLTVRGGYIGWNGWGPPPAPGGFDARTGVYLQSPLSPILEGGARVENNHPSNFLINGGRF